MRNYRLFKEMNRHLVVIVATGFVILGVILLTIRLHHENRTKVLSQFQDHQIAHAEHLAHQLKFFFNARSQELQALSSLVSRDYGDLRKKTAGIENYSKMMEYVKTISLYNGSGAIVYSTDSNAISLNHGDREFFSWAKKKENKGKVFGSPIVQPDSFMFLFAVPLYQDSFGANHPELSGKFVGVLTLTVDLRKFFANQFHFLRPEKNLHHVGIMDTGGKLLFQLGHPWIALRNSYEKQESCNQCHNSFDFVEKILREKEGMVDYEVRNLPKQIAAFSPVEFGNVSWVVVVNSSFDEVTVFLRKSLKEHLILLGIVVLALAVSSILMIWNDRLKVRAEEEAKHWREKITERKKAEEALRESEERFRMLVETMTQGLGIVDEDGLWTYANDRLCQVLGYFQGDIIGRPVLEFLDETNQNIVKEHMINRRRGGGENYEIVYTRPDGQKHYAIVSPKPIFDKDHKFKGSFALFTDITGRKRAEEALRESEKQLRYLSSQLLTAQETERRRISRELHDELGGALAVLKLRSSLIEKNLQKDQIELREECKQNLQYIDQIIEEVGRLSRDLSPSILEDLGLSAALRRLIDNFVKNYNIKVASDIVDFDHLFPMDAQIMIYRIFQEAFTNIGKHAQARNVSVKVRKDEDRISFLMEDDGKGFDVKHAATKEICERGLGLATMDERARMLGGSLDLWSEGGKGTRITLSIPINRGESL
jgi:PAS domain S-box-containing protein